MSSPLPPAFDTLSLHAGQRPDPVTGARAVPIYETTSYVFTDADHAAALFNLESAGHLYTRISNPTTAVLEERVAALEGGVGAVCDRERHGGAASGHRDARERRRSHRRLVVALRRHDQPARRRRCRASASTRPSSSRATTPASPPRSAGTRLVIGETIGNPGLEVLDIPAVADIAHDAGVPLLIDNTFATPYLSRPIEQGADIVMHSLTKWIGGHGLVIGGALVDGGRFDWIASGRHATMIEPYAGYHGLVFAEHFGPVGVRHARAGGGPARFRRVPVAAQAPRRLLTGVETLSLAHAAPCREHGGRAGGA